MHGNESEKNGLILTDISIGFKLDFNEISIFYCNSN